MTVLKKRHCSCPDSKQKFWICGSSTGDSPHSYTSCKEHLPKFIAATMKDCGFVAVRPNSDERY